MPSSKMAFFAVAATGVTVTAAVYFLFFGGSGDDDKCDYSSVSPVRHTSPAPYPLSPPNLYPPSWTNTRSPTIYDDDQQDHADGVLPSRLPRPRSTKTSLTGLAPSESPTQATYQCTHFPDVVRHHVSEDAESRPTRSHTQPSSSSSGHVGVSSSTRVANTPLAPSRLLNVQSGVEFAAVTTAEDKKAAIELREQARRSCREMCTARDLVKSAHKRRDSAAAQRHKQDVISHKREMKKLDRRAARIFFRVNNEALPKGTVDLHDLHVAEAMEYAKKELQSAVHRNDDEICFIVGKGLHSEGGQSKLRPHLESLCDERRFPCSLDPRNAGKLMVQLNL